MKYDNRAKKRKFLPVIFAKKRKFLPVIFARQTQFDKQIAIEIFSILWFACTYPSVDLLRRQAQPSGRGLFWLHYSGAGQ